MFSGAAAEADQHPAADLSLVCTGFTHCIDCTDWFKKEKCIFAALDG